MPDWSGKLSESDCPAREMPISHPGDFFKPSAKIGARPGGSTQKEESLMGGLDVIFLSWRGDSMKGYSVQRHANDYVAPLWQMLFDAYVELQAYLEADPEVEEYIAEIAELRGKCWALAYSIGSFHQPDNPEGGLSEARQAVHGRWLTEVAEG